MGEFRLTNLLGHLGCGQSRGRKKTYQGERYNVRCIENGKIDLKFLIFSLFVNPKIEPKPN